MLIATTNFSRIYSENGKIRKVTTFKEGANEISFRDVSFNGKLSILDCSVASDGIEIIYPLTDQFYAHLMNGDYFYQLLIILCELENLSIAHLDFRFENIGLLDNKIVLRDFGNAYPIVGNKGYLPVNRFPPINIRAPEFDTQSARSDSLENLKQSNLISQRHRGRVPFGCHFDCRADVWSLGCLIYFSLKGHWPYVNEEDRDSIDMSGFPYIEMFEKDYEKRPFASQLCQMKAMARVIRPIRNGYRQGDIEVYQWQLEKKFKENNWSEEIIKKFENNGKKLYIL